MPNAKVDPSPYPPPAQQHSFIKSLRACILARMGRKKDAMAALQKSIELDAELLSFIAEDEDLKLLRSLPAFQKLLREAERQRAETDPK
ncbi:MAG TPA: hypothetical protein VFD62_01115 [Pyrinomonadaceae bacterium]|nr:hypothetical protein [Pyrinomonadaceae bacterium]